MNTTKEELWGCFTVAEATALLNHQVIRQEHLEHQSKIENIGFIAGVLTLNEETEVVVKFIDGIYQFTKHEFNQQITIIKD